MAASSDYSGENLATSGNGAKVIDLRSDTVTKPSPGMRQAMNEAPLGDDVYGEDPTVTALEEKVAALLGKEAGLYVSSGTMSNLIGVLTHCGRGDEYLIGDVYHVYRSEALGTAVLGGAACYPLPTSATGALDPAKVKAAVKPDDPHNPMTKLLSLENTVSSHVQPQDLIEELADTAHEAGLQVHMDGARLMNAAVAQKASPADLVAKIDTVSLCLSKGLGAPVGSVLTGPKDFIRRARRLRKMLGGGMRQAGVIAAAGLYALENNVDRLAEDHANAERLAEGLRGLNRLKVHRDPSATNMVFVEPDEADHDALRAWLGERGITISAGKPAIRLVSHLDVNSDDIDRTVEAVQSFYAA